MYIDYFLKFTDADEASAVLFESVGEDSRPRYTAIDVLGTLYKPTGSFITTDEGDMPEMVVVDGWHVNVRHNAEAPELEAFRVFPETPMRGWA